MQRRTTVPRTCGNGWSIILLILLATATEARSASPATSPQRTTLPVEYSIRHWSGDDGLPLRSVEAILQTRDGFLWFGMNSGLGRFDGAGFKVYDPRNTPVMKVSYVTALAEDPQGALWVGTAGGGLIRRDRYSFQHFGRNQGLENDQIKTLHFDRQGRLWVGTDGGGIFLRESPTAQFHPFNPPGGIPERHIISITDDASGQLLITTYKEGPFRLTDTGFQAIPILPAAPRNPGYALTRSPTGRVWLGTTSGVYRFEENSFRLWAPSTNLPGHDPVVAWEIDEHEVWIGTAQGMLQWRRGIWTSFPIGGGSSPRLANAFVRDREGNIWQCSEGSGVVQLRRAKFVALGTREGLLSDEVTSVAPTRDESLWIGTSRGLHRLRPDSLQTFRTEEGLPDNFIFSIAEDTHGTVWVATRLGGLAVFDGNRFNPLPKSEQLPVRGAWCLAPTRDGSIWAGTAQGAFRFRDQRRVEHLQGPGMLSNDDVRAITEDAEGALWLGTSYGLCRRIGDRTESFTTLEGLPPLEVVITLLAESDGSLWIGTLTRGLFLHRNGRFHHLGPSQGFHADGVVSITREGDHHLWIGTSRGVFRIERSALLEAAQGSGPPIQPQIYGRRDGLRTEECTGTIQPTAALDTHGRFWIATADGLGTIHPEQVPSNPAPPLTHIERIALEGSEYVQSLRVLPRGAKPGTGPINISNTYITNDTPAPAAQIRSAFDIDDLQALWLPAGIDRIEFEYSGLTYVTPEGVGYQYQLVGYDRDWVPSGSRRAAHYTRVPPGNYVFRMRAFNEDGVGSQPISIAISIAPSWWQQGWVRAAALATAVTSVLSLFAYRLRSLERRRFAASELSRHLIRSQENERCRIAGELHDGVGQELQLIRNRSELALKRLKPSPPVTSELEAISSTAARAIQGVRHLSRGLRPPELDQLGLTQALRWLVTQTAAATTSRIESKIDPIDGTLPKELELDFYRIAQEGLNNAVKHAHAPEITLEISRNQQGVELSLFDNGIGFSPAYTSTNPDQGSGLKTMRERATMLGGFLHIRSEPGVGSRLTLTLPASRLSPPTP